MVCIGKQLLANQRRSVTIKLIIAVWFDLSELSDDDKYWIEIMGLKESFGMAIHITSSSTRIIGKTNV